MKVYTQLTCHKGHPYSNVFFLDLGYRYSLVTEDEEISGISMIDEVFKDESQ